ncbi:alpha/beta hydrolase [uncultured Shewanella sp.]|uniref:RBBP9/YdeN family alpha/beta hydrolase n=1 Tax=uncultured Shewanella sp. TaxID=173975 RepID=UPI002605A9F2|nr:alpha/beta hydrolase [uncultured Shewanella sp.]
MNIIFVPGYLNSLAGHWQRFWFEEFVGSYWVEQEDWAYPDCNKWVSTLNKLVDSVSGPTMFITHSLGGSTVAHWCQRYPEKAAMIKGAFMVAVPDVQRDDFPKVITGYSTPPLTPLPFPCVMCASSNDPYCRIEQAHFFAKHWQAELIPVGALGHINTDVNIGDWPEGKALFDVFNNMIQVRDNNEKD